MVARTAAKMPTEKLCPRSATTPGLPNAKIADGREKWLVRERYRILRDEKPDSLETFAEAIWDTFSASCETAAIDHESHGPPHFCVETV